MKMNQKQDVFYKMSGAAQKHIATRAAAENTKLVFFFCKRFILIQGAYLIKLLLQVRSKDERFVSRYIVHARYCIIWNFVI